MRYEPPLTLLRGRDLGEVLSWARTLPGSQRLRALVVFDNVYGFMPPHPQNPPTKRPLVALMKQARASGVGVMVSTQNPMDLDYRALGNAGLWLAGRLQTDADRARVIDGLSDIGADDGVSGPELGVGTMLLQPRCAMSVMRGPMTRGDIKRALGVSGAGRGSV